MPRYWHSRNQNSTEDLNGFNKVLIIIIKNDSVFPRSDVGTNYFCEKPLTLPRIGLEFYNFTHEIKQRMLTQFDLLSRTNYFCAGSLALPGLVTPAYRLLVNFVHILTGKNEANLTFFNNRVSSFSTRDKILRHP